MIEIGLINIAFTKGISAHYQAYKVTSTVVNGRGSKADLNPARSAKVGRDPTVPGVTVPATIGCSSGMTKSASPCVPPRQVQAPVAMNSLNGVRMKGKA